MENQKKNSLSWEETKREYVLRDQWLEVRKSAYRFPDGKEYEPFYSYSRRDYVVIVALDTEGSCICVRQFRQGIKQVTTEFPAGGIERKDGKEFGQNREEMAEDALEAAKRELLEETGHESEEWLHLLTVPANATIADNYAHLYLARNCRPVAEQSLDEYEFVEIVKLSPAEIDKMIATGEFLQAMHILAWLLALPLFNLPD